jgi:hypothetical protein
MSREFPEMSENQSVPADDLKSMLAQRAPRRRAKSTTILIVLLLLVLGMIIGVPLGRMSAQLERSISYQVDQPNQGPPDQGPAQPN